MLNILTFYSSSTEMQSALSLILAALLLIINFTEAVYIMGQGGFCLTYDSTLPGTLIKLEPCKYDDPRHGSWEFIELESGASLLCIKATNICDQVGTDGKEYLAKKDATELAQQWKKISGSRYTNGLTGPGFCSQSMYVTDGKKVSGYVQQQRCSDHRHQKFVSFSSIFSLAKYLFYQDFEAVSAPFPHEPIYPYRQHYNVPMFPYYHI